jgi:hypothetical protein
LSEFNWAKNNLQRGQPSEEVQEARALSDCHGAGKGK